jgi:SAM-dependent methyltransferase
MRPKCAHLFPLRNKLLSVAMDPLQEEAGKLARSWAKHEAAWLRDYLVADVEDPRLNVQSILSRHFLVYGLAGERFAELMEQELRFAAAMNWVLKLARRYTAEDLAIVRYGLEHGADNAEGIQIPEYILRIFQSLAALADGLTVPNYITSALDGTSPAPGAPNLHQPTLDLFGNLWSQILAGEQAARLPVLEPACGSANDYRFLVRYGIGRLIDYTGLDLCEKNVLNARALFPQTRFAAGNAFDLKSPDKVFDLCFVHDLFEHLSVDATEAAVRELCRVTRRGMCVGFFSMEEMPDHIVRPVGEYHWNTLSMSRMRRLFSAHGFTAKVMHIGSLLEQRMGCGETHNPNAYTFFLWAQ